MLRPPAELTSRLLAAEALIQRISLAHSPISVAIISVGTISGS
jgi:hypothetical protein